MTIIIDKHKIAFFSAPKVACTSIKTAFFEVENSFPFREFWANGEYKHIHNVAYPAVQFESVDKDRIADYHRFTIVRDPVARLLSCYSNRVGYYRELSADQLGAEAIATGLKPDPDIHEFIANLEAYRAISNSIRLHSNLLCWFLGSDASYYERVYSMKDISAFEKHVASLINSDFSLPRLQTGGEKVSVDVLTSVEMVKIKNFYREDYEVYGQYF